MSSTATLATTARVLGQLRRDRRTLAMLFLVAPALLILFKYIFDNQPQTFERIGAPMIGLFPLILMFLITSIAMLRERTNGTLERLMSLPIAKLDLLLGYALAFALLAAVKGAITGAVGFGLLGVQAAGSGWAVVLLAIANALLGMALGLFFSAFASTEFQAVQFMPAVLFPQILLAGLLVPRAACPTHSRSSPMSSPSPTPTTHSPRSPPTTPAPGSGSTSSSSPAASHSPCYSAPPPSGAAPHRRRHHVHDRQEHRHFPSSRRRLRIRDRLSHFPEWQGGVSLRAPRAMPRSPSAREPSSTGDWVLGSRQGPRRSAT